MFVAGFIPMWPAYACSWYATSFLNSASRMSPATSHSVPVSTFVTPIAFAKSALAVPWGGPMAASTDAWDSPKVKAHHASKGLAVACGVVVVAPVMVVTDAPDVVVVAAVPLVLPDRGSR